MDIAQIVLALAGLGWLVSTGLGLVALINPKWFGIPTRLRSSVVFFGISTLLFLIGIAFLASTPTASDAKDAVLAPSVSMPKVLLTAEIPSSKHETISLDTLMVEFDRLTDLQQAEWSLKNEWTHWVRGTCIVSEVSETGILSEIQDSAFEVSCEIADGNRVILFYPLDERDYVLTLNKEDQIAYEGNLKLIKDWGFWLTGYVVAGG